MIKKMVRRDRKPQLSMQCEMAYHLALAYGNLEYFFN